MQRTEKYKPFSDWDEGYNHHPKLEHLEIYPWTNMLKLPPETFMPITSLLEDSEFRPGGYKTYDAGIAIPASTLRETGVVRMSNVTPARKQLINNVPVPVNTYWETVAKPQMSNWGLRGSILVRPAHPYLVDITKHRLGNKFIEAAHMLAHLTGDLQTNDKWYSTGKPRIYSKICSYMAELVAAYIYDIPLDVGTRYPGEAARPEFEYYGIAVRSTTAFGDSYLRIPWKGKAALPLDETLAVIATSVFIQPPPTGLMEGTMKPEPMDRWTCIPTLVTITGWETPEVIMHHTLASRNPENDKSEVCYTMLPDDLMPPDEFWMYLKMAQAKFGSPKEAISRLAERRGKSEINDRYMYVEEWFGSEHYQNLLLQTPPGLCTNCVCWNHASEKAGLNVPKKPRSWEPKPSQIKAKRDWLTFNKQIAGVVKKLLTPAWLKADAREYQSMQLVKQMWRLRKKNFRAKWVDLKARKKLEKLQAKVAKKGGNNLTPKETKEYLTLRKTYTK